MRPLGISIRTAIWLGAAGIAILLLAGGFLVWSFVSDSQKERAWAEHSHEVVDTLQTTQLDLFMAVSERGAIMLFDETRSHDAMESHIARFEAGTARLVELTADNPSQGDRALAIQRGAAALVEELQRSLRQPLPEDRGERLAIVAIGTEMRNALVQQFAVMIDAEKALLAERMALSDLRTRDLVRLLIGTLAAAAVFAVLALWGISRHLRGNAERIVALERSKAGIDAAYRELAVSERHLQSVLDHANDAIFLVAGDGRIMLANKAAAGLFGYPLGAIVGAPIARLVPAFGGAEPEVEGQRADGSRFPADLSIGTTEADGAGDQVCILRDSTERHRLNRLKSEFVSTVSHELRTPLTSIRGSLGLVLGGMAGAVPDKAREFLEIAHNNSARLVHLVNDILDMEKIESGRMEFRREWTSTRQLVEQALTANQAYGDQYGVTFRIVGDIAADSEVYADPTRIQQVMANLLSNAAKFSTAGGGVEIEASEAAGYLRFAVRDHGSGIPEAFRSRIFQRFAQADSSDMRSKGGTGLGLSIAKAIVDHHGGSIGFETPADGGTRFHFTLPCRTRPDLHPLAPARDETGRDPVEQDQAGRRVLIVEDDPDVAKLLSLILAQTGWRSQIAYSAREARLWLERGGFDAVTLDVLLPDEDGLSLFRRLRSRDETRDLPVVIVSARTDEARQALNGDAIGVVDWIEKPIDQERLQQALRNALRHARKPARILHVEDDPDIVHVIRAVMGGDAEVVAAQTLAEARRLLASGSYSLVIIDVGLPDGSGLDLIDAIRQLEQPPPILIFSARDYDSATASRVAASLVKSRTDNRALHGIIQSLIEGGTADHGRS